MWSYSGNYYAPPNQTESNSTLPQTLVFKSNLGIQMENGYHLYDFKGTLLREEPIERFKQFLWRPRPPTLLSKEEQKKIRKNLREYSRIFDDADQAKKSSANRAVVELRKRLLDEWRAWRHTVVEEIWDGDAPEMLNGEAGAGPGEQKAVDEADAEVVEEIVEEIIEETEEVVG